MVGQLRIYTINKGMMDSWLKLFHEVIAPKTLEFGMGIQSAWTDEENEDVYKYLSKYSRQNHTDLPEAPFQVKEAGLIVFQRGEGREIQWRRIWIYLVAYIWNEHLQLRQVQRLMIEDQIGVDPVQCGADH